MFQKTLISLLAVFFAACVGRATVPAKSPQQSFDEHMNFVRFAAIPLGITKNELEKSLAPIKTEMSDPASSAETFWILRDPSTGHQKAALTFNEQTQTLVGKVWIVNTGEAEQDPDSARARFVSARFVSKDLPSENPHLLYGEKLLVDENQGISIEIRRVRNEVSTIQWWDPKYRSPAQETPVNRSQYTF